MVSIGNKPLLLHQINLCKHYGITDIILITGYLSFIIENYFGDGSSFAVKISYLVEQSPLGTAGGLKEIEHQLDDDFLLFYGDVMVNMNLTQFIDFHKKGKADATLALHPNDHPYDSDLVEIDHNGRVIQFFSRPHDKNKYYSNLVNAGLYILSPKIFKHIKKGIKSDFGNDILPNVIKKLIILGYNTAEYLKDMGTPRRLETVKRDFKNGKIQRFNYEHPRKAIFLDRDGTINKEVTLCSSHENFELYSYSADSIKKINDSEYLSIVITNQSVIARGLCGFPDVDYIHKKMETLLGRKNAKLDMIYYCPHHPDYGFKEEKKELKIKCECRKPLPGLIYKAAKRFNIDLPNSYIIGDSFRDIECGKNAGLITIGLRSGHGCKKIITPPHYLFENLLEAVDYIINDPHKEILKKTVDRKVSVAKSLFVISVAGNTRSGKSTLTTYLQNEITKLNYKILRINLDDWLIPKSKRTKHQNVFDRFQINKICADLQKLLKGNIIQLYAYDTYSRKSKSVHKTYDIKNYDIILIDGVVAFCNEFLQSISDLNIYCEIPIDVQKNRIFSFYRWKGLDESQITTLYNKRLQDEYSLIQHTKKYADIIYKG